MDPSYNDLLHRTYSLLSIISNPNKGKQMATVDIQKLTEHMRRAQGLTQRAAASGSKGEAVMNSFEKTMNNFDDHMGAISEYDKQLQAMIATQGNGGPPLEETFPPADTVAVSVTSTSSLDTATGDPKR